MTRSATPMPAPGTAEPQGGTRAAGEVPDCQSCGACCAFSWEWPAFIGPGDGEDIPAHMVEDGRMRCHGDRCVALAGRLGVDVHCTVYADRPLVCREFTAGDDECLAVRRHFGFD